MYINVNRDSPEVCGMSSSLTRLHLVPQMTHMIQVYCNIQSNLICLPFPLTILSVSYAHYTLCSNLFEVCLNAATQIYANSHHCLPEALESYIVSSSIRRLLLCYPTHILVARKERKEKQ